MMTMSVAVQAPSASNTSSMGPGALFDARSESTVMACPDGLVATNFCSPTHLTVPVCMQPPEESIAGQQSTETGHFVAPPSWRRFEGKSKTGAGWKPALQNGDPKIACQQAGRQYRRVKVNSNTLRMLF